ncbi:MAG: biotin--[acetyl-CoA-carboxylase] ligase [Candidatus Promineifilaceae bacterium]
MVDDYNQEEIGGRLATRWLGRPLHYLPSVGSTNEFLRALAQEGAPQGSLVVADYQSQGRGRRGRRWLAPAGTSVLASLLFRPGWPPERAAWLTMLAGLAAAEAIEAHCGLGVQLKWPNDLIVARGRSWAKLGGLLLEAELSANRLEWALVGLGINVNGRPPVLPDSYGQATSMELESGRRQNRAEFLAQLLVRIEAAYEAAAAGASPLAAWSNRLVTLGRSVVAVGKRRLEGVAEACDEWGRLLVRDGQGQLHALAAGDVSLRG